MPDHDNEADFFSVITNYIDIFLNEIMVSICFKWLIDALWQHNHSLGLSVQQAVAFRPAYCCTRSGDNH